MNKYSEHSKAKENRKEVFKKISGSVKGCVRKRAHESEEQAYSWQERNKERFPSQVFRAYKCKYCLKWHLTKKELGVYDAK